MKAFIFLLIIGILATLAIVPVKSKGNKLDNSDLKKEVENIEATSRQGILLSDDLLQNKVTPTFVSQHIDYLIDNARQSSKTLVNAKPGKQIQGPYDKTITLANKLQLDLEKIAEDPRNKQGVQQTKTDLKQIRWTSSMITTSL